MRTILCFFGFLVSTQLTYSQNSIGVENDLKGVMSTRANAGSTVISSFRNSTIKGNRYLFDSWTQGSVTSANDEVYSNNYKFNFDKINQDIYAEYGSSNVSVLLDKSKVKRFTIGSFVFINSILLKNIAHNIFYQVLVDDSSKISLYKLTSTKFIKSDPNNIMNVRTGNFSDEYIDDISYYVSIKNVELKKISLNENNMRKTLKEKSDKVDEYFSSHSSNDTDEAFLTELIRYVNH